MTTMLREIQRVAQASYARIQPTLSAIQERVSKLWDRVKTSSSNGISCAKNQANKAFTKLSDAGSFLLTRVKNAYNRAFKPASQNNPVNA
ncbi:MAG: hypothetical protein WCG10_03905 [Chlamydiota bacterium]